jgi:8-oxo-dGTP pyrophosphatase MutT (NUDIX family)
MTKFISFNKYFLKIKILNTKNLQIRHSSEWSEASTLILVAKNNETVNNDNKYNYRVLMAKRSTKSSFMSNAYIFPGGKLDFDDFNHKWLKIFGDNNCVIRGNRFVFQL